MECGSETAVTDECTHADLIPVSEYGQAGRVFDLCTSCGRLVAVRTPVAA